MRVKTHNNDIPERERWSYSKTNKNHTITQSQSCYTARENERGFDQHGKFSHIVENWKKGQNVVFPCFSIFPSSLRKEKFKRGWFNWCEFWRKWMAHTKTFSFVVGWIQQMDSYLRWFQMKKVFQLKKPHLKLFLSSSPCCCCVVGCWLDNSNEALF